MKKIAWYKNGHLLKTDDNKFRFCLFKTKELNLKYGKRTIIDQAITIDVDEYEARQIAYALLDNTRTYDKICQSSNSEPDGSTHNKD